MKPIQKMKKTITNQANDICHQSDHNKSTKLPLIALTIVLILQFKYFRVFEQLQFINHCSKVLMLV